MCLRLQASLTLNLLKQNGPTRSSRTKSVRMPVWSMSFPASAFIYLFYYKTIASGSNNLIDRVWPWAPGRSMETMYIKVQTVVCVLLCTVGISCNVTQSPANDDQILVLHSDYFETIGLRYEGVALIRESVRALKTARRINASHDISRHTSRLDHMFCSDSKVRTGK